MQFQVEDMNATYWAYGFINPKRLAKPIKIKKTCRVWTRLDDSIEKEIEKLKQETSNTESIVKENKKLKEEIKVLKANVE